MYRFPLNKHPCLLRTRSWLPCQLKSICTFKNQICVQLSENTSPSFEYNRIPCVHAPFFAFFGPTGNKVAKLLSELRLPLHFFVIFFMSLFILCPFMFRNTDYNTNERLVLLVVVITSRSCMLFRRGTIGTKNIKVKLPFITASNFKLPRHEAHSRRGANNHNLKIVPLLLPIL